MRAYSRHQGPGGDIRATVFAQGSRDAERAARGETPEGPNTGADPVPASLREAYARGWDEKRATILQGLADARPGNQPTFGQVDPGACPEA